MNAKRTVAKPETDRADLAELEQIPNVGPATASDLKLIGFNVPSDLPGNDPFQMHEELCRITETRHDPCVIDVFISAVRFMEGEPARPWWKYTSERKRTLEGQKTGAK